MVDERPQSNETLLANLDFLRSLAMALVSDADEVDDLVQETCVLAIQSPPARNRPPRPWLATVLRNIVRLRYRGRVRRELRERIAARRKASTSDSEQVAANDQALRALTAALESLPDTYRRAITQRYLAGLGPREIARREGVPLETVRSRLRRGLARLRATLVHQYDYDRDRWVTALSGLTGLDGARPRWWPSSAAATKVVAVLAAAIFMIVVLAARRADSRGEGGEVLHANDFGSTTGHLEDDANEDQDGRKSNTSGPSATESDPAVADPRPQDGPSTSPVVNAPVRTASPATTGQRADSERSVASSGFAIAIAQSRFGNGVLPGARVSIVAPSEVGATAGSATWTEIDAIEDPASAAFHHALPFVGAKGERGILTIGAAEARLVHWTRIGGEWHASVIWAGEFGGEPSAQRLRDVALGDVDGDGADEIVLVTHDRGVVLVLDEKGGTYAATEVDRTDVEGQTVWIHEVEVGDTDGDGLAEIYCTPSSPSGVQGPPTGTILRYQRGTDGDFERSVIESRGSSAIVEILLADLDGAGVPQLFAVVQSLKGVNDAVEVWRYDLSKLEPVGTSIATLPGKTCRFLEDGDLDGDGRRELVAATAQQGIYVIRLRDSGSWLRQRLARGSVTAGFEHPILVHDLDGDGRDEVLVASDRHRKLQSFRWRPDSAQYARTECMEITTEGFYWRLSHLPGGSY